MITKFKVIGLVLLAFSSTATIATEYNIQKNTFPKLSTIELIRKELHEHINPIVHSYKYKNKECTISMKLSKKGYIIETRMLSGDVGLCNLVEDAIEESELRHKKMKPNGGMIFAFGFSPKLK